MRDAIPAGNRNAERNFHDTLSITKGGMFMSLFGLHGDFVGTNIKSIQAAYQKSVYEDPAISDADKADPGIGDLMKEESRYNRTFREYRIGKDAAAAPLPKKPTEEISRKPIPRKPTSLDRLVELERMEHKTKNPFKDKEIEDIMAAHDKRMAERRALEAANAPAASAAGGKRL